MVEFLSTNKQGIFEEIVERGRELGVENQEAYNDLCDDVVNEKLEVGEMDEDSDTIGLVEQLKGRWSEYTELLGLDSEQPQL